MGILESLLGAAMQGGTGGGAQGQQANPLAGALMQLLAGGGAAAPQQPASGGLAGLVGGMLGGGGGAARPAMGAGLAGGLAALVQQFSANGYEAQAKSWVSTGANMPIAPQALTQVFGADRLTQLSQQYGIPREELLAALAEQLPQAVNELTPHGAVPQASAMEQLLGQFMGGGSGGRRSF
jgi:uncharacterized protein YidB (DUF937 family)